MLLGQYKFFIFVIPLGTFCEIAEAVLSFIMVFMATILSLGDHAGDMPDNLQLADGEISIAFWSFVFVLLLIVTVWFYITQIAPMRRSVCQVEEEVDKEEEVAKRILEHLSNDLRLKNEKSKDEGSENTSPVHLTKITDSSIYEYVDDEIHIHYSQYAWDDDSYNTNDFPVATGTARRHSMENMDLIFPGVLPSIVEEEELEEETDTDVSEKSQESGDFDGDQYVGDLTNFPTIYKPNGNNNVESKNSLLNKEQNNLECDDINIVISLDNQELQAKTSGTKQDRMLNDDPHGNSNHSLYSSAEENNVLNINSSIETATRQQKNGSSFSSRTNNITQAENTKNCKISTPTAEPRHSNKEFESVMAKVDFTSGSVDTNLNKDDNCSQIIPGISHDDMIEQTSVFTLSSSDLKPSFTQDANEFEEHEVKICTSNMQKISCVAEDQHSTHDFRLKQVTNPEHVVNNNLSEEVNKVVMEHTGGLTGRSQVGELLLLNGFGDDIADSNGHTTHAWTFFAMSGGDETTTPKKTNLKEDVQSDKMEIPSIIVDSYDESLPIDKSIIDVDSKVAMNGHQITTQYGDSFETDIDIDDIDLSESDNLDNEGDFSIYFKRHVSVTDLDKILSEEGQDNVNCNAGDVLETDLSMEDLQGEQTEIDIPRTSNEVLQKTEMDNTRSTIEKTYMEDEMDTSIEKSVIVSTTLSDNLDMQAASDEDLDDTDSSDDPLPKSYTVESLFDDVSFQKDGVYGELVLSQLNENHGNKRDESSFDPHGDDWHGFSEEIRRGRKPFLFTIPEDDEIGLAEFDSIIENCFVGAMDNPIYDNEVTRTEAIEQEKLLNAPIATVETFDSDLDLDEVEESNKSEKEKYEGEATEKKQTLDFVVTNDAETEIDKNDGVTEGKNKSNGVTEKSGNIGIPNVEQGTVTTIKTDFDLEEMKPSNNSDIEKHHVETAKDEEILENRTDESVSETTNRVEGVRNLTEGKNKDPEETDPQVDVSNRNDVIQRSGKSSDENVETKDGPRSVKIEKKIKIFVRKEVTVAEEGNIMEDVVVGAKQVTEDVAMKEVDEKIILACREASNNHPYDVVKSEIRPVDQFMKCMTFHDEKCNYTEINAKDLEVVTKTEQYLSNEPEPKTVSRMAETQGSTALQPLVSVDANGLVETVDDTIEAQVLPMEAQDSEGEIKYVSVSNNQVNTKAGPALKVLTENAETLLAPMNVHALGSEVTQFSTQNPVENNNVAIVVGRKTRVVAKTMETEMSQVKAQEGTTSRDVRPAAKGINKTTKINVKEKASKTAEDSNMIVSMHPSTQSQECSSVKINVADVRGKLTKIGNRENKQVWSSRVSPPTALEKEPRKVYLSSCNIRLTKSHEDLRLVERTPGRKQESIEEEEVPDTQSSQSEGSPRPTPPELNRPFLEDDVFKSVEPPSVHTAKITVQEVLGDRQRIVILNVKKKVHGKARWKSLNDLDSLKMALSPRRSSDLGIGFAGVPEEGEIIEENNMKSEKKASVQIVPVVEVKSRRDRRSLPEIQPTGQLVKAPVLSATAQQSCETLTESEVENTSKDSVMPVLHEEPLQNCQPVIENETHAYSKSKLPIIKATAVQNRETGPGSMKQSEIFKATVTSTVEENLFKTSKTEVEANVKVENQPEIKARVSRIYPEKVNKPWIGSALVAEESIENTKPPKRITRVHDISRGEIIPKLEKETVTKIADETTKGNKIKIHVSHRLSSPDMKMDIIQPRVTPLVEDVLQKGLKIESGAPERSSTLDDSRRQERESGYGSLGQSPSASVNTQVNSVFVLEGANERSISSLSSIDDEEFGGETLGESKIMVTDLDALLAQQGVQPPASSDLKKPEVKEKVRVLARMEPVPEKVVRINKEEDNDGVVIRHVKHEEPIVVQPIIIADTAEQEESQVISAFLVNDGYDDDELDEVFLEEYTPYHEPDRSSSRTHSSDADSETSSISSLPLKHRHRQTRAALEAGKGGMRNRTESSGSSKTATPVAELENEGASTSSRSNTPKSNGYEISREESFAYHSPEQMHNVKMEKPRDFTSAFTPASQTAEFRRPRARSHGHKSDEELVVQNRLLGDSFQDVKTFPGLNIDKERFKEAADSRKSMPDLSVRKDQTISDSPYLRGLSAHTRKWLSQNVWMDPSGQQEQEDLMTSDMFLYPSNRFQPGSNIDASFLSLANERDFPDDISVSTLSTRPQSPMSEFSFAGETPYWGLRRGSTTVIKCSNPRCEREEILFTGEKTTYTSCPACFTYYCARTCRRMHWSEHKKVCFFGRINSYIRSFIYLCHKKESLKFQLSQTAKDGYKKKGRGSVMVTFASAQLARKFMTSGCTFFPSPPTYSSLVNVRAEGVISKHKISLMQHVQDYQPEEEFVLNLAIIAGKMEDLPANPVPRRKVSTVLQVIKIPLSSKLKETPPAASLPNDPNTEIKVFYLPKCSRHEFVTDNEARRHYCRNISKNLKQYGIRLKHDYPDVYEKLCRYVDQNIHFTEPLTVYGNHGKKIVMCKIMPETGNEATKT